MFFFGGKFTRSDSNRAAVGVAHCRLRWESRLPPDRLQIATVEFDSSVIVFCDVAISPSTQSCKRLVIGDDAKNRIRAADVDAPKHGHHDGRERGRGQRPLVAQALTAARGRSSSCRSHPWLVYSAVDSCRSERSLRASCASTAGISRHPVRAILARLCNRRGDLGQERPKFGSFPQWAVRRTGRKASFPSGAQTPPAGCRSL